MTPTVQRRALCFTFDINTYRSFTCRAIIVDRMITPMKFISFFAVLILAGCSAPRPAQPERTQKVPTATEIFNLRTKCAELSRQLDESLPYGPAWTRSTVSNYEPKSNRCYVTLEDDDGAAHEHSINLYDGQTRELLAYTRRSLANGKHVTVGMIFSQNTAQDDCSSTGDCGFRRTEAYIDGHMKRDDR